jgi:hypothetical protein
MKTPVNSVKTGDFMPPLPSLFGEGGRVTGAGRGGAFLASTRIEFAPLPPLGCLSIDGNPPSVGECAVSSKLRSKEPPNVGLDTEIDCASDGNVGLGMRGAVADVGVEMPELVPWLAPVRNGVNGAGMADRRGSARSKSDQEGSDHISSSSGGASCSGAGGSGLLPLGKPFVLGNAPAMGGLENGLEGNLAAGLGGGASLT